MLFVEKLTKCNSGENAITDEGKKQTSLGHEKIKRVFSPFPCQVNCIAWVLLIDAAKR